MTKTWTVWVEDIGTHSTWIAAKATNHNAADAVARVYRAQNHIVTVSAPSVQF